MTDPMQPAPPGAPDALAELDQVPVGGVVRDRENWLWLKAADDDGDHPGGEWQCGGAYGRPQAATKLVEMGFGPFAILYPLPAAPPATECDHARIARQMAATTAHTGWSLEATMDALAAAPVEREAQAIAAQIRAEAHATVSHRAQAALNRLADRVVALAAHPATEPRCYTTPEGFHACPDEETLARHQPYQGPTTDLIMAGHDLSAAPHYPGPGKWCDACPIPEPSEGGVTA